MAAKVGHTVHSGRRTLDWHFTSRGRTSCHVRIFSESSGLLDRSTSNFARDTGLAPPGGYRFRSRCSFPLARTLRDRLLRFALLQRFVLQAPSVPGRFSSFL